MTICVFFVYTIMKALVSDVDSLSANKDPIGQMDVDSFVIQSVKINKEDYEEK